MVWPAYTRIAAASAAGRVLIASLDAGGNTIFCAASWLCTSLLTNVWPQLSSPPATSKIAVRASPAKTMSASNVLLRISMRLLLFRRRHHCDPPADPYPFSSLSASTPRYLHRRAARRHARGPPSPTAGDDRPC